MGETTDHTDSIDAIEVWCAGEEWCPVATTASLIGKKWHPVIIHRLLNNVRVSLTNSNRPSMAFPARCFRIASTTWRKNGSSIGRS